MYPSLCILIWKILPAAFPHSSQFPWNLDVAATGGQAPRAWPGGDSYHWNQEQILILLSLTLPGVVRAETKSNPGETPNMICRAGSSQGRDCKEDSCSIKAWMHLYIKELRGFCLWEDERWVGIKITRWQWSFLIKAWCLWSNWSRVYLIRKIAGSLNNLQYKVCTKERVSRLGWMCILQEEFERSSDTWKLPTMAPAGLRGQIEMVLKKIVFFNSSSSFRATGQKGKGEQGSWKEIRRAGEDTRPGMAIAGAVRGEGAPRMHSGTIRDHQGPSGTELPPPTASWQPGSLQASPTAPSIPHTAFQTFLFRHNSSHLASEQINTPSV